MMTVKPLAHVTVQNGTTYIARLETGRQGSDIKSYEVHLWLLCHFSA